MSGKKNEFVSRIRENLTETDLEKYDIPRKYIVTELGDKETKDNEYVLYMHRLHSKTRPDCGLLEFDVWTINKLLGTGDKSNWEQVIEQEDQRLEAIRAQRRKEFEESRSEWLETHPEGWEDEYIDSEEDWED